MHQLSTDAIQCNARRSRPFPLRITPIHNYANVFESWSFHTVDLPTSGSRRRTSKLPRCIARWRQPAIFPRNFAIFANCTRRLCHKFRANNERRFFLRSKIIPVHVCIAMQVLMTCQCWSSASGNRMHIFSSLISYVGSRLLFICKHSAKLFFFGFLIHVCDYGIRFIH